MAYTPELRGLDITTGRAAGEMKRCKTTPGVRESAKVSLVASGEWVDAKDGSEWYLNRDRVGIRGAVFFLVDDAREFGKRVWVVPMVHSLLNLEVT